MQQGIWEFLKNANFSLFSALKLSDLSDVGKFHCRNYLDSFYIRQRNFDKK
jgi:hypothetical protein